MLVSGSVYHSFSSGKNSLPCITPSPDGFSFALVPLRDAMLCRPQQGAGLSKETGNLSFRGSVGLG